jgi:hypothetical protein
MYNKNYYTKLNYTDYLSRENRYISLAKETTSLLSQLQLLSEPILDYGCAVGHLLYGLNKLNLDCLGYDISEWALKEAKKKGNVVDKIPTNAFGVGYFLDVLEHIKEEELDNLFHKVNCNTIIFRIPVVAQEGEDYVLEVSRKDKTHVIKWTKDQWRKYLAKFEYKILPLNLYTIYDSPGVFSGLGIRF